MVGEAVNSGIVAHIKLLSRGQKRTPHTVYTYGHGLVNINANWRTIMGTNSNFIDNWSNPNILFEGNSPGIVNWNDFTRVLRGDT